MHWELWDTKSRNLVEEFDSEEEALLGVQDLLTVNSPDYVDFLALGVMYDEGESREMELPPALRGEELRARLAECAAPAVADEAARAVHARIRKWLAEESWTVEDMPVPPGSFNVVATLRDGRAINIFQHKDHLDHITMSLRGLHDGGVRQAIGQLPEDDLRDSVWSIYRDVSMMGVECYGLDTPITEMMLRTYVYFDGLTKDALMHRILLVNRAYTLAMRTFVRALEASGRSGDLALSSEDLRRFMRPVSQANGPLTVAS
jgi:hypothetical protein